jgi:hypothetical protein
MQQSPVASLIRRQILLAATGEESLVNAIGGCCGTGPEHIAAIKEMASAYPPRQKHSVPNIMRLSGLEPLNYEPNPTNMRETFLMIGERCNVAGSIIYKKAIVDGNYDKAAGIALQQVGSSLQYGCGWLQTVLGWLQTVLGWLQTVLGWQRAGSTASNA